MSHTRLPDWEFYQNYTWSSNNKDQFCRSKQHLRRADLMALHSLSSALPWNLQEFLKMDLVALLMSMVWHCISEHHRPGSLFLPMTSECWRFPYSCTTRMNISGQRLFEVVLPIPGWGNPGKLGVEPVVCKGKGSPRKVISSRNQL